MQITRRTSILYAVLQTDLALTGGICDNSLSVGDIYVHDKETRPLYVKFTVSFLMSSVFLGSENSFSHKINSSCSVLSFWGLREDSPAGTCGSGCTGRLRVWGPEGGRGRTLLSVGRWQPRGPLATTAAAGLSTAKEMEGKTCRHPCFILKVYLGAGKQLSYHFLVI